MPIDINKLYQRWVRECGEKGVILKYPSLRGLYSWFLRQSKDRGIDPEEIDFEALADPKLNYYENQNEFRQYFPPIPEPELPLKATKEELQKALSMYEEEANKLKEELGLPITDMDRINLLEGKIIDSETKLSRTKEQLKKAREESARLEAEIAKAKAKPLEKPPIREEPILSEKDVADLRQEFYYGLSRANIPTPQEYDSEFDKTLNYSKTYIENSESLRRLVEQIIKRRQRELPSQPTPEIEKRIKSLEETVERIKTASGVAGARRPRIVEVEDWYSHDMIEIDEDEIFRLKILLYDKAKMVHPKYFLISPDSQLETYGYTSSGMLKSAIAHGLLSVAQIRQAGLDPKTYGIGEGLE